jgi:hypothetical protein
MTPTTPSLDPKRWMVLAGAIVGAGAAFGPQFAHATHPAWRFPQVNSAPPLTSSA